MSSENEPIWVAAPTSIGHGTKQYRLLHRPILVRVPNNIGHGTEQYRLLSSPRREASVVSWWDAQVGVRADGVLVQVWCISGCRSWCVALAAVAV